MLTVTYPEKYKDESSRVGKKFKFYKIEPVEMEKPARKKEIRIGEGSGRISALRNQSKQLSEGVLSETYSDWLDSYLEELGGNDSNHQSTSEDNTRTDTN